MRSTPASDWPTMRNAVDVLARFGVAHEARVVSAHRMPDEMFAVAFGREWYREHGVDPGLQPGWFFDA